jgi:hypothetical protein
MIEGGDLPSHSWILDTMAVSLAAMTIVLALAGIVAFLNLRDQARKAAKKEANTVCPEIAERVANQYLQENLPKILDEYRELGWGSVGAQSADDIASAQED